ncbi:MAG: hypothetical protein WCS70_09655 [Verrucomicrobiota bacterium]
MKTETHTHLTYAKPVDFELFTAADASEVIQCSPTSVKRISAEIKLPTIITRGGIHLYTLPMIERIRAELERRRIEALR